MVLLVYLVKPQIVVLKNRVRFPKVPKNWEDNGGCLSALDAGGRRFESCFSDKLRKYARVGELGQTVNLLFSTE